MQVASQLKVQELTRVACSWTTQVSKPHGEHKFPGSAAEVCCGAYDKVCFEARSELSLWGRVQGLLVSRGTKFALGHIGS